jgi:hypothetical protein
VEALRRFCDSIRTHTRRPDQLEIVLVVDSDDEASCRFEYPDLNIRKIEGPPGRTMSALNMAGYSVSTGCYLALLNDDIVVRTAWWDDRLLDVIQSHPDGIVLAHVNDTIFKGALCTFPILTRTFCELAGGICPEGYIRYRIDDHIHDVFTLLAALGHRRRIFLPDVIFQHLNLRSTGDGRAAYIVEPQCHAIDSERFRMLLPERKRLALAAAKIIGAPSHSVNQSILGSPDLVPDSVFERNARFRERLSRSIRGHASPNLRVSLDAALGITTDPTASPDPAAPVHVVVSFGEISNQHGTGCLVKRLFRDRPGIFSIRFRDDWGIHDFGDWHVKLEFEPGARSQILRNVRRILQGRHVETVTCVPVTSAELVTALAVRDAFGARLCVWIMDDQNIAVNSIPDDIMKEALESCSLRLTTHPELRDAYQHKYGLATYILPAVVPAHLIGAEAGEGDRQNPPNRIALLGSFSDQTCFDRLCSTLESCDCSIDWYGQNHSPRLGLPNDNLARAHIRPLGFVPEDRLAAELKNYALAIVPAGALDGQENHDNHKAAASLRLPGQILFAIATSYTPVLVVGGEENCGARFVRHFGVGDVAPYEKDAVRAAIARLREPGIQREMRRNAAAIAPAFSDQGVGQWLSASTELGRPVDNRFDDVFSAYSNSGTERHPCEAK